MRTGHIPPSSHKESFSIDASLQDRFLFLQRLHSTLAWNTITWKPEGVAYVLSRFGAAIHDDVTPSDSCKPAPCFGHYGNESDEPPEHHRQHGRHRSGAERLEPSGHLRH